MCSSASLCCLLLELGWTRFAGAYKFRRTTEFWKMYYRSRRITYKLYAQVKMKFNVSTFSVWIIDDMLGFCHFGKIPKKINLSSRWRILPCSSRAQSQWQQREAIGSQHSCYQEAEDIEYWLSAFSPFFIQFLAPDHGIVLLSLCSESSYLS